MRILATAFTAAALTFLPVQAGASTPNPAPEQTKPEADAALSNDVQAATTLDIQLAAAGNKKPTEQPATETGASAGAKPDQSAQASANQREASPSENQ